MSDGWSMDLSVAKAGMNIKTWYMHSQIIPEIKEIIDFNRIQRKKKVWKNL